MTDPAVTYARLAKPAPAGTQKLELDRNGGVFDQAPYLNYVVSAGKDTFDYKYAQGINQVVDSTVNLTTPLLNDHEVGDVVAVYGIRVPVKMSDVGGVHDTALSACTRNRVILRKLLSEAGIVSGGGAAQIILALDGSYGIDDRVLLTGGANSLLTGWSGDFRRDGLWAHDAFPFSPTYANNMVSSQDQNGTINQWPSMNADRSFFVSKIFLDGRGLANSVGLVGSPQQPGYCSWLLLKGFRGVAAFAFANQNCIEVSHIFGEDNYRTIYSGHVIYQIRDLQIRNPSPVNGVCFGATFSGSQGSIVGVQIFGMPAPGPALSLGAIPTGLDSVYIDGMSAPGVLLEANVTWTDPLYHINGMVWGPVHPSVKILRDVQRNFSLLDADLPGHMLSGRASSSFNFRYGNGQTAGGGAAIPHPA